VSVGSVGDLRQAFPSALGTDPDTALTLLAESHHRPSGAIGPVSVRGEPLRIPCRIYFPDIELHSLPAVQQAVLHCLFTRHCDGFVRESHLRQLLPLSYDWIPPFVVQLLGEYVYEIIEVVAGQLESLPQGPYRRFCAENPEFLSLTRKRIVSYWDCYHRARVARLADHPSFRVLAALESGV